MKIRQLLQATALFVALAAIASGAVRAQESTAAAFQHGGWRAPLPADWIAETPASSMRSAQYRVPGANGSGDGEMVVFFYAPGNGGSQQANIERWESQFSRPDGGRVESRVSRLQLGAIPVTMVELSGSYARGVGMGPVGEPRPDQTLVVAMIETPDGRYTLQLYGPRATVAAHRKGFDALLRGFTRG